MPTWRRCSAALPCFNVIVRRRSLWYQSDTLAIRFREHPEFGAARGCRAARLGLRVRTALSGESGRITTLRVEASSESTWEIWGISVMAKAGGHHLDKRWHGWSPERPHCEPVHDRDMCRRMAARQCPSSIREELLMRQVITAYALVMAKRMVAAACANDDWIFLDFHSLDIAKVRKEWPPAKCRALRLRGLSSRMESEGLRTYSLRLRQRRAQYATAARAGQYGPTVGITPNRAAAVINGLLRGCGPNPTVLGRRQQALGVGRVAICFGPTASASRGGWLPLNNVTPSGASSSLILRSASDCVTAQLCRSTARMALLAARRESGVVARLGRDQHGNVQ